MHKSVEPNKTQPKFYIIILMNNGQMPLKTKSKSCLLTLSSPISYVFCLYYLKKKKNSYKKENDNVIVLVTLMVVWVAFNSLIFKNKFGLKWA